MQGDPRKELNVKLSTSFMYFMEQRIHQFEPIQLYENRVKLYEQLVEEWNNMSDEAKIQFTKKVEFDKKADLDILKKKLKEHSSQSNQISQEISVKQQSVKNKEEEKQPDELQQQNQDLPCNLKVLENEKREEEKFEFVGVQEENKQCEKIEALQENPLTQNISFKNEMEDQPAKEKVEDQSLIQNVDKSMIRQKKGRKPSQVQKVSLNLSLDNIQRESLQIVKPKKQSMFKKRAVSKTKQEQLNSKEKQPDQSDSFCNYNSTHKNQNIVNLLKQLIEK